MVRLEPPRLLKRNKFHRRLLKLNVRLPFAKQHTLLLNGYSYGLVSLEPGIVFLTQLKTIYKTLNKYIKPRRRLSRRKKAELARSSSNLASKRVTLGRQGLSFQKKRKRKRERVLLSIFPSISFTKKGLGTRMGKGKGGISQWGVRVRAGRCLFQIKSTIMVHHAVAALTQIQFRLPILTRVVIKNSCLLRRYGR